MECVLGARRTPNQKVSGRSLAKKSTSNRTWQAKAYGAYSNWPEYPTLVVARRVLSMRGPATRVLSSLPSRPDSKSYPSMAPLALSFSMGLGEILCAPLRIRCRVRVGYSESVVFGVGLCMCAKRVVLSRRVRCKPCS